MERGLWWWHGGAGSSCAPSGFVLCQEEQCGRAKPVGAVLVPWVSPNVPCEGLERCHPFLHGPSHQIHTAAA